MAQEVNFTVDVGGLSVSGRLHRPAEEPNRKVPAAVLLCRAVLEPCEAEDDLFAAIEHGLVAAGIAVATFDPRIRRIDPENGEQDSVPDPVECAVAAFNWLTTRIDLDGLRLHALGHGIGAIVAAGLAMRVDKLARLCLISPATPDWLADQIAPRNGTVDIASLPPIHRHLQPLTAVPASQAITAKGRQSLVLLGAAERAQHPESAKLYEDASHHALRQAELMFVPQADALFSSASVRQICVDRVVNFFSARTPAKAAAR